MTAEEDVAVLLSDALAVNTRLVRALMRFEMRQPVPETHSVKAITPAEWVQTPHVAPCVDEPPGVDL